MKIKYTCKSMGLNCEFVVIGETMEEVTSKAFEHVREMHADQFNSLELPAEIERMKKSLERAARVMAW